MLRLQCAAFNNPLHTAPCSLIDSGSAWLGARQCTRADANIGMIGCLFNDLLDCTQELERYPDGLGDMRTRQIMWQLVRAVEHLHRNQVVADAG